MVDAEGQESFWSDREQIATLFANLTNGFVLGKIVTDSTGKPIDLVYLDMNQAYESLLGRKREEVVGRRATEVFPVLKEDLPPQIGPYARAALQGESTAFERLWPMTGRWYNVMVYGPKKGFFAAITEDITERKKAEEALDNERNRLNHAQQIAHIGSWEWNLQTGTFEASTETYRIFGSGPNLISTRRGFLDVVHPDDWESVRRALEDAVRQGRPYGADYRVIRPDGSVTFVHAEAEVSSEKGKPVRVVGTVQDITDRKKAEEALRESEERFRLALKNAPVSVAIQDRDFRYIWAYNQKTARPDEILGRTDADIFKPDEVERITTIKRRVLDEGAELREQMWLDRPSGRIYLDVTWSPVRDNDGQIIGVTSVTIDLTNMKLAEEELKESEARYRSLFRDNSAPMLLIDPSTGDIIDANRAACEYYGYGRENLLEMKISNINTLELDEVEIEMSRSVSGEKRKFDFRHLLASGEVRDVEVYSGPIYIQGRQLLYSIIHDVTDRKRAEESLRESEAKYRGLFENIQEVAAIYEYIYDDSGHIIDARLLDANPLWQKAYSTNLEQVQGKHLSELFGGEYFDKTIETFRALKATGDPIVLERPFPSYGPVSRSSFFPLDENHLVVTALDISHIKRAQRRAEEYSKKLERSNAELQQFAYVASHDLQEPLRMVIAYLGLLNKKFGDELSPQAKEYMSTAAQGSERMRQLIDDLLQFSRIDSRKRELTSVDMNKVARTVESDQRFAINEGKVQVIIEELPTVMADEVQMTQVLQNLISNAIKFRGPEEPRVEVTAQHKRHEWIFAVKDNGIGIDPKYHGNLFKMFQRLHTNDEYPGTGIGLAISKKIIERHGGRIWVESKKDEGSTFFFSLPEGWEELNE